MSCRRCLVSGHVHGVFFRASTREQAQQLGVSGYARNLPDGRVEVMACGADDSVTALCAWLQSGPPQAHVNACVCEPATGEDYSQFVIR